MRWGTFVIGLAVGVLVLAGARFVGVDPPEAVHHHANFAVFVDGERVDLSADRYMEDVENCPKDPTDIRPRDRAHLHDNNPDVVHVHHAGATWGHLLANLGLGLGEDYLITDGGERYFAGEERRTMKFVVNGFQVSEVHNRPIGSGDRLVISIGPESPEAVMEEQFPRVASNATEYNETSDPAGCAGAHGPLSFWERVELAFWGA